MGLAVKVNGETVTPDTEGVDSFSDLMEKIATDVLAAEEIVTAVQVNGEPLTDETMVSTGTKPLSAINTIEITTESDPGKFAVKLLAQTGDYLGDLSPGLCEVADTLRTGSIEQANSLLVQGLDGLMLFIELIGTIKQLDGFDEGAVEFEGESMSFLEDRLTGILRNIEAGQESEDWVTVADLLEYELAPIIQDWKNLIPSIQRSFQQDDS